MTISINNVSGVIQISTDDTQAPRCYYGQGGTSGKFYPIPNSRYLIQIGGDSYEVYWQDLNVGEISPITFPDAGRLLGEIFTTGVATAP